MNARQLAETDVTELTEEQRVEIVKAFPSNCGLAIKVNKSGGIHLYSPLIRLWSFDKSKTYAGGGNIDAEFLRALCSNEALQEEVLQFLEVLPSQIGMTKEEKETHVALYHKESKSKATSKATPKK